ncbi:MAG TPA: MauE/DoxX family redox-associated membrane protein [Solirubrobacterales bacterium]|nr:MauE/DoxX family redox-associated membrane protein [Solirubrobacterales bacterium]
MVEIVLRVILGVVLAGAALAKLASPRASIAALASFGFADSPLRPTAWAALIAVELALAVAVALGSDAAAYAAAVLMAMFAALTVAALLRGRAGAPCACFGPRSTVSRLGALRNLALAAAFAAVPSVDSISIGTQGWMWIGIGVALAACVALAVAVLALAREVGMLRLQLGTQGALEITGEGPEIGSSAWDLSERLGRNGADLGLAVFTSEGCGICQTLAPAIDNVARDPRVAVGVFDEVAEAELWRRLAIPGSPFALALDREGKVLAKGIFNNLAQLESVLATAERRGQPVRA